MAVPDSRPTVVYKSDLSSPVNKQGKWEKKIRLSVEANTSEGLVQIADQKHKKSQEPSDVIYDSQLALQLLFC